MDGNQRRKDTTREIIEVKKQLSSYLDVVEAISGNSHVLLLSNYG
jgi:hypothetical protein